MMTPTLEALAHQLAASPRWDWPIGMVAVDPVGRCCWQRITADRWFCVDTARVYRRAPAGLLPLLDYHTTAALLLVLAREASGCPEAVAGTVNGRWMVFRSLEHYYRWREGYHGDPPPLTGVDDDDDVLDYDTEVEALAAVILRGGE